MRRKRYRLDTVLAAGELLAGSGRQYRVGALIGSGAFAHVYRGEAPDGRAVAIKEFHAAQAAAEAREIDRVVAHEERIMRGVSGHPAFPDLLDAFDCEGRHYLVQTFIDGQTLEDLLAEHGPYQEEQVVRWMLPLCDGVVHIHERGIVHHDLKPANIKITPAGSPVVLDLGAAQVLGEESAAFYGSDGYMPPEIKAMLAQGNLEAHKQTDVFALGCIMYELILGAKPTQDVIDEQSGRLVGPLLRRLGEFHAGLVGVMTNAISFSQGYRYESARQMLEDLHKRGPASPEPSRRRLDFEGPGHSRLHEELVLVNRGGGTLQCQVATRTPWLTLAAGGEEPGVSLKVSGNRIALQVWANTEDIKERGVAQQGEITIKHELGELRLPCTLTVQARPAMAQADPAHIYLAVTAGQTATAALGLRNVGEQVGQFTCRSGAGYITTRPVAFTLEPLQTIEVVVQVAPASLTAGTHHATVQVATESGHRLDVPVSIDVTAGSLIGSLAAKFLRNRRGQ